MMDEYVEEEEEELDQNVDDFVGEEEEDGGGQFGEDYFEEAVQEGSAAHTPSQPSVYRMQPIDKVPGEAFFACPLCNKTFQAKHTVYRHIKEVHRKMIVFVDENDQEIESMNKPAVLFTCDVCGESFNTKRNLDGHMKGHARMSSSFVATNGNNNVIEDPAIEGDFGDEEDDEEDDDIGDHDGIDDDDEFPLDCDDSNLLEQEDDDDTDFQEEPTASGLGIPYRCPYGICPQFFTTKELMKDHLKNTHSVRLELVPLSTPRSSGFSQVKPLSSTPVPIKSYQPQAAASLYSNMNGDKRFPCTYRGCISAFTRRDRLNLHIRTKHQGAPVTTSTPATHQNQNHVRVKLPSIENERVKLPSIGRIAEASRLLAQQISTARSTTASNGGSSTFEDTSSHLGRNGKPTIHPKKYACDFPGCDKAYTKGSHVKRHKLSAHPELFDGNQQLINNTSNNTSNTTDEDKRSTQESLGYFDNDDDEEEEEEEFSLEDFSSPNKKAKVETSPVKTPVQTVTQGTRTRPRRWIMSDGS